MFTARWIFSSSFVISAAWVLLTGTTSLIACSYSATPTSVQAGELPPITLGIVAVLKWALPGSSRSGEYTRKKVSPITSPRLSTSGRNSSSVVPG